MINNKELMIKTIYTYGVTKQVDKAIEECLELATALQRFKYERPHNVEEEIADVEIMIEQLKLMFNEDWIREYRNFKLDRLEENIIREEILKC